jgi:hypothetical protein
MRINNLFIIPITLFFFLPFFFNLLKLLFLLYLFCKLLQSLLLQNQWSSISLIVCLTIPIITVYLSTVEKSTMHRINTTLSIFLFFEFYFDDSFRMCFIKSYSLNFANFWNLFSNILFDWLKILFVAGLLDIEHVLHYNNF